MIIDMMNIPERKVYWSVKTINSSFTTWEEIKKSHPDYHWCIVTETHNDLNNFLHFDNITGNID